MLIAANRSLCLHASQYALTRGEPSASHGPWPSSTTCEIEPGSACYSLIAPAEVQAVVVGGELVEDYPDDVRGHSCLLLGSGDQGRLIHVLCSPKVDYLAIITAYLPDPALWSEDFRSRR